MSTIIRSAAAAVTAALALATLSPATVASQPPPRSSVPQEWGAQGSPIHRDCDAIAGAITRMQTGMTRQEDWLRRAEMQLRAAEDGVVDSQDALRDYAMKAVKDLAMNQIAEMATLKAKVQLLRVALKDPKARRRVLELAKRAEKVDELADELLERQSEADRNFNFEKKVRENKAALEDLIKYAEESGLAEQGISALALAGGPAGKLAAEAGKVIIEVGLLGYGSSISDRELRRARADLDQLRAAHERNEGIIRDLGDEAAAASCPQPGAEAQQGQQGTPAPSDGHLTPPVRDPSIVGVASEPARASIPEPSATPVPDPEPVVTDKGGGAAADLMWATLGAGALVGGLYLYENNKQCVAPTNNVLTVCAGQGGSSQACKSAVAAQKEFCSCLGMVYSGGNCVKKAP